VLQIADNLFGECQKSGEESSILPESVDLDAASKLVASCYRELWPSQEHGDHQIATDV